MRIGRKLIAGAIGLALAPVIALAVPATMASAHGYVSAPPSRQAECAAGTVSCGDIKYEPQSVEGPKGQQTCNGGNARFAELNDDSKGWKATAVGNSVTFTWTFTAQHSTTDFEYFIGGQKVASFDMGGKQPPQGLQHTVDLSGHTGRQKLLAVWNIADTSNAFYACVDLQVG